MKLGAAILAAGASSRMGQPKLLLRWGEKTILEQALDQWRAVGATQVAVVWNPQDQAIGAELDRLGVAPDARIANSCPEQGMFSSILCAAHWAGWKEELTHYALALSDQPQIELKTLQALTRFASEHPGSICQPARGERARHPVILPKKWLVELRRCASESTLREFLNENDAARIKMRSDDSGLDFDLDYPADYQQALKTFLYETP